MSRSVVLGLAGRVLTAAVNLAISALLIRRLGVHPYGQIAVVLSFVGLLAFADLGVGSSIVSRMAVHLEGGNKPAAAALAEQAGRAVRRPAWILIALAATTALVGLAGSPPALDLPALAALLASLAVNLPMSIHQRVLVAHQRSDLIGVLGTAGALLSLAAIGLALTVTSRLWVLVAADCLQFLAPSLLCMFLASRLLGSRERVRISTEPLGRRSLAFLVITIAGALSYETDELVVGLIKGPASVAIYDVHARPFAVLYGLAAAGVGPFWAGIAAARTRHDKAWVLATTYRLVAATTAAALLAALVVCALLPLYIPALSGHRLHFHLVLALCFVAWAAAISAGAAIGVACNGLDLVDVQMRAAIVMTIANVGLSVPLTYFIGPVGPVVGTASTLFVVDWWLLTQIRLVRG